MIAPRVGTLIFFIHTKAFPIFGGLKFRISIFFLFFFRKYDYFGGKLTFFWGGGGGRFLWIFFVHDIMSIFVLKKTFKYTISV